MMKHILFMPDGNKRFAKEKKISLGEAYAAGAKSLRLFSDFFLLENNWNMLTMHWMSKYTHDRTDGSLAIIYDALRNEFTRLKDENYFSENNIKFKWIDNSDKLPENLVNLCQTLEKESSRGDKICYNLLGYDLETDERIAYKQTDNYEDFTKKRLIPNIDLIVRTTEMRLSKGPVYAMSQAQMLLINKFNPEVSREDLEKVLVEYNHLLEYRMMTNPVHLFR
ncbi:MAG: undecaprenyl diphosphate synthase family protein [Candidatus Nanoarchaeia archaeon]